MKKFIYTITSLVAFAVSANAQVGIETENVSDKAILDFPDQNADGTILLPYVENLTTAGTEEGTIIYDSNDGNVKIYDGNNWVAYGSAPKEAANIATHDANLNNVTDAKGVAISDFPEPDQDKTVTGVLVLESNRKALALPKVNGVENLESPKAGMICYDTSRNALAIFNGEKWILRN